MQVSKISVLPTVNATSNLHQNKPSCKSLNTHTKVNSYSLIPSSFKYNANISFTGENKNKLNEMPFVDFNEYKSLSDFKKERYRELYSEFDKLLDERQLEVLLSTDPNPENLQLPLQSEKDMDNFLEVAKMYSAHKDHPIICLGRSPKWFLNTSIWMKDGIEPYKFVAFSGRWYWIYDGDFRDFSGLKRMDSIAPNKTQIKAYRKYLKSIEADPISIIEDTQKAGKKTIITDYVDTGKGFTSFLEVMSDYAEDLGVLDEFGHSIEILSIGNKKYRQERKHAKGVSDPHVHMPPLLEPYDRATTAWGTGQIMEQTYYDVDYDVFKQLLINQNPNECRSTYYPCKAWTVFQPDKFKISMSKTTNLKTLQAAMPYLKSETPIFIFDPIMSAYRNLLNFRILDALNTRNLLKDFHIGK